MTKEQGLVKLARATAKLAAKASEANRKWRDAFFKEFGHEDVSDALVEAVDYSSGNTSAITYEFILENSEPGNRWG